MRNVYEAYIVDSRSYEHDRNDRPIWTHKLVASGVFTNKEDIKKWARKNKAPFLRVYVYANGSSTLYDSFGIDARGQIHHRGFAHSVFKNRKPTTISRR